MPVIQQTSRPSAGARAAAAYPGAPGKATPAAAAKPQAKQQKKAIRTPGAKKIRTKELPPFSRQLSAMLLAGMPLLQTLAALEEQTNDKNFQSVVNGLKNSLQEGSSFSEALAKYPSIFDSLYVNMVKAGESGGLLGETEARLATFLESSARLIRKVKSAMTYPVIVLCLALSIATGMIIFIVPVFAEMFADFDAALPGPTQAILNLSNFLRKNGVYVAAAVAALVIGFKKWKATPSGAMLFAQFVLKFPVFGELSQKVATSRFARTFAQLLKSGVPILKAMEIVAGATGNKVFEKILLQARTTVEQGEPLSAALIKEKTIPRLLVHMLSAGEKVGKIDEMMENIANFYDDEVETMLDGLTSLLEPLLMIFLGLIIGSILISMFLPIFKMGEIVSA